MPMERNCPEWISINSTQRNTISDPGIKSQASNISFNTLISVSSLSCHVHKVTIENKVGRMTGSNR